MPVTEPGTARLRWRWLSSAEQIDERLRSELHRCWRDVANAGGAVGFPFLPVGDRQVREAIYDLAAELRPGVVELLVTTDKSAPDQLLGWLVLAGNDSPLTRHWATVLRVQTSLAHRGRGVGRALMTEAARRARDDRGLRQLHLAVRGGVGLEDFYSKLGWHITGRWPAALRFGGDDMRDEVLMILQLT